MNHDINDETNIKIEALEILAFKRGLADTPLIATEVAHETGQNDPGAAANPTADVFTVHPRILIVDDDDQFRGMLRQTIEKIGFNVLEAVDGEEGLKIISGRSVDIVITDIIMPRKEGLETILEIRRKFPAIKIIAMSGGGWYGTGIDFDMAQKLGATTLGKPFKLEELLKAINDSLN